jgi:hypothetical protein
MRVIFCLPGRQFSNNYFNSWNATVSALNERGISYAYSMIYDPVVYYTRNRILGGQNTGGKSQKPWQSQISYDKMIWIDSDIVWKPEDVLKLLGSDKSVIAGTYLMGDGKNFPIVEHLDFTLLATTGTFRFMDQVDINTRTSPFKVSYTGFGFVCVTAGVFESMEYPWFQPRWVSGENFHDFCAEDVGFCWSAQELGHEIWVDPAVRVSHEKTILL